MTDDLYIDCVEMKLGIQETLADEFEGLSNDEMLQHWREELARSKDPLARWWRGEHVSTEGQSTIDELLAAVMERKAHEPKRFDCVQMKRDAQAKIYEETKDMTEEELREYYDQAQRRFEAMREQRDDYGTLAE